MAPSALNAFHVATEFELVSRHLHAGDRITMLICQAELPSCLVNPQHRVDVCLECIGTRRAFLKRLPGRVEIRKLVEIDDDERTLLAELPRAFSTSEALSALTFDGFDLGEAALSTLISVQRESRPDLARCRPFIHRLLMAGAATFLSLTRFFRQNDVDFVYLFNGRVVVERAILRACERAGVPWAIHERGHDGSHFKLFHGVSPHNLDALAQDARDGWASAGPEREKVARDYYDRRAVGRDNAGFNFVRHQVEGRLPPFPEGKRTVGIFLSSEDEFAAVGERPPIYADQVSGVQRLRRDLDDNIHLFVRVHPNLATVDNSQTRAIAELEYLDGLTLIGATDDVSTYALVDAVNTVVTFGSTVGAEATYRGQVSIGLGIATYRALDVVWQPTTHEQAIEMIVSPSLKPKSIHDALVFAHYFSTFGELLPGFVPESRQDGQLGEWTIGPTRTYGDIVGILRRPWCRPLRVLGHVATRAEATARLGGSAQLGARR